MSSEQGDSIYDSEKRIAELWIKYKSSIKKDLFNVWLDENKEELHQIEDNLEFIEHALIKLFEKKHAKEIKTPILEINEILDFLKKTEPDKNKKLQINEKWIKKISLHLKSIFLEIEDTKHIFHESTEWTKKTIEELVKNANFLKLIEKSKSENKKIYEGRLFVAEHLDKLPETCLRTMREANELIKKAVDFSGEYYAGLNKFEIYKHYFKLLGKALGAYDAIYGEVLTTEKFNLCNNILREFLSECTTFADLINQHQESIAVDIANNLVNVLHEEGFSGAQADFLLYIYQHLSPNSQKNY